MINTCDVCDELKQVTYLEHINKNVCDDCEHLPLRLEGSE